MLYILGILILLADQISKFYAIKVLKDGQPFVIVDKFLQFNYVENYGAAFGILQNKQTFFLVITSLVIIGIIVYMIKNRRLSHTMKIGLVMIISGAMGNLIDRAWLGYVVDFIDIKFGDFYDYPVFNIADSAIVIGTIIVAILVFFDKYERAEEA